LTIKIKKWIKITTSSPKIRWTVFVVIALLALAVRLPQLGGRPMHTDESINAYITGELLAGEGFHYDPQDRHGPALFIVAEPLARLLGAKNFPELTESQLRLTPVIAGSATVLLLGAAVEMFGFIACVVAALLFAFAPLPVYYNRDFIHETLFVAATLGLILSGWRALKTNSVLPAALAGWCAALMLACKETAVIHFFALAVAMFACRFGTPRTVPARTRGITQHDGTVPGVPSLKIIFSALAVFIFTVILLFTWFGRNWPALADLFRAIPHFAARAGGEGHEKPFWYYAALLGGGGSGGAFLCLAALGILSVLISAKQPSQGAHLFLVVYALLVAGIYSAIPYKTPWLALNFWLPLAILAGLAIEWICLARPGIFARTMMLIFSAGFGFLVAHDTRSRVFLDPAGEHNPYAYVQTVDNLLRLPPRLEQLAGENKLSSPRIAVVAADPWPLPWYLRKYSLVGFWQPGQETGPADFFITSPEAAEKLGDKLKNWRPEFFGVRAEVLIILWTPTPVANP
jgi:uncharacterized protein (TIGR03663 family)